MALADVARSSIDAQYYLWAGDTIGRVLLDRIIAAADRGVRVRLLVDDYESHGQDTAFETLHSHPTARDSRRSRGRRAGRVTGQARDAVRQCARDEVGDRDE